MSNTPLALRYGGGLSGLSRFLKSMKRLLDEDAKASVPEDVAEYIDDILAAAYASATRKYGTKPRRWSERARAAVRGRRLGYYRSLDGYPALDRGHVMATPALYCVDGATIHSQAAQSYTQFVNMADVDSSMSILPPGQSEDPNSRYRAATFKLWEQGQLHPAPLSRKAVEKIARERVALTYGK